MYRFIRAAPSSRTHRWVKPKISSCARRVTASLEHPSSPAARIRSRAMPQWRCGADRARPCRHHRRVPSGRLYKDGQILVEADSRHRRRAPPPEFRRPCLVAIATPTRACWRRPGTRFLIGIPGARPRRRPHLPMPFMTPLSKPWSRCRARDAAIRRRCGGGAARCCARPSCSAGAKSRCAMSMF